MFTRRRASLIPAVVAVLVMLAAGPVSAQEYPRWSMSALLGGHLPNMRPLSDGLYKAPMLGEATILVYEGGNAQTGDTAVVDQNITEIRDFSINNPVPPVSAGTIGGVEFTWHPNDRHSLVIGMGSWESVSQNTINTNIPLQQYFVSNVVSNTRRDKISYTEYTVGWRYNLFSRPKLKLYSRVNMHEVFDIDFREDQSFLFVTSPIEGLAGVRRDMVVEAQTASLLMGQVALGAEWFLTDWLSVGVEGGYMVGERSFTLRDVTIKDDFLDTATLDSDSISRNGLPYREMSDGTLGYLKPGTTPADVKDPETRESHYAPLVLGFDGWRFAFKVSFYY
jgi:hypothetical protein